MDILYTRRVVAQTKNTLNTELIIPPQYFNMIKGSVYWEVKGIGKMSFGLGSRWSTFYGLLVSNRFPFPFRKANLWRRELYNIRWYAGSIGGSSKQTKNYFRLEPKLSEQDFFCLFRETNKNKFFRFVSVWFGLIRFFGPVSKRSNKTKPFRNKSKNIKAKKPCSPSTYSLL
jgi:hypothetical protein